MRLIPKPHFGNNIYLFYPKSINDFGFVIANLPFFVPTLKGVYVSEPNQFARVSNHVTDLVARSKTFTAKLLQQNKRNQKLRKSFSKF